MFEIDKGIAAPDIIHGRKPKYPFKKMEVGDSFFAPNVQTIGAYNAARRLGFKFCVKKSAEGGVSGLRCWRIK